MRANQSHQPMASASSSTTAPRDGACNAGRSRGLALPFARTSGPSCAQVPATPVGTVRGVSGVISGIGSANYPSVPTPLLSATSTGSCATKATEASNASSRIVFSKTASGPLASGSLASPVGSSRDPEATLDTVVPSPQPSSTPVSYGTPANCGTPINSAGMPIPLRSIQLPPSKQMRQPSASLQCAVQARPVGTTAVSWRQPLNGDTQSSMAASQAPSVSSRIVQGIQVVRAPQTVQTMPSMPGRQVSQKLCVPQTVLTPQMLQPPQTARAPRTQPSAQVGAHHGIVTIPQAPLTHRAAVTY